MPTAVYNKNGKLVMSIAQYPGEMAEAEVDKAVTRPDGQVIAFCRCERAHPGLADAVECETVAKDVMVLYKNDGAAGWRPDDIEEKKPRRRRRSRGKAGRGTRK